VRAFLSERTVLLTGSTGFLAKVFLEKLLWEQPDVRKVFLVIAPRGAQTAEDRLAKEIIAAPLFDRLRARHGADFEAFAFAKLVPVAGDLGVDGLGLSPEAQSAIEKETDVVVHSAATTTFDERFDVAVNINTLGPRRVLALAKRCENLKVMCHVSTAFVNGLRVGPAAERAFRVGDSVANELAERKKNRDSFSARGASLDAPKPPAAAAKEKGVDPYEEIALAFAEAEACDRAESGEGASERMTRLGSKRARANGWQDTYVFTKAMGEQILSAERDDVPLVIVRPSIVEGALSEPFPGWIEGVRMADPLILAYGKGLIRGFVGDKQGVLDIVPVDAVVNVMLAALARKAGEARPSREARPSDELEPLSGDVDDIAVYHVATSTLNPLNFEKFLRIVSGHFAEHPLADKRSGDAIVPDANIEVFSSRLAFEVDTWLRQDGVRFAGVSLLEKLKPGSMSRADRRKKVVAQKTWEQLKGMGELYAPYTSYAARFSSTNVQTLRKSLSPSDARAFPFELESLDWREYLSAVHIPGLLKHALRIEPRGEKKEGKEKQNKSSETAAIANERAS
jgi:fatty acyl-CoA reductase